MVARPKPPYSGFVSPAQTSAAGAARSIVSVWICGAVEKNESSTGRYGNQRIIPGG
jgi:hypothetical protein